MSRSVRGIHRDIVKIFAQVETDLSKRGKRRVSDLDVEEGDKTVEGIRKTFF